MYIYYQNFEIFSSPQECFPKYFKERSSRLASILSFLCFHKVQMTGIVRE